MNSKAANIQLVIDSIEAEPKLFDMRHWDIETPCGTARCIGGWATFHIGERPLVVDTARWLGVENFNALFFAAYSNVPLSRITKDMAVAALKDLQKDPFFKGWNYYYHHAEGTTQ